MKSCSPLTLLSRSHSLCDLSPSHRFNFFFTISKKIKLGENSQNLGLRKSKVIRAYALNYFFNFFQMIFTKRSFPPPSETGNNVNIRLHIYFTNPKILYHQVSMSSKLNINLNFYF
ncbi:hypothetical protein P8452_33499 [Trifolium repens]|nr:hypothetical protein P8452_33499 [Trifolium repens]